MDNSSALFHAASGSLLCIMFTTCFETLCPGKEIKLGRRGLTKISARSSAESDLWRHFSAMRTVRVLLLLFVVQTALVAAQRSGGRNSTSPWKTLNGDAPLVIARGGFSGLLPYSSTNAYLLSLLTSLPNVIVSCDVQLTKDGFGICAPDIKLNNATNIASFFPEGKKTYLVNGAQVTGWFSIDFTLNGLTNVSLIQGIFSRSSYFDGNLFPINTVEQVAQDVKPPGYWLNIEHDLFFREHNLSMRAYVLSVTRRVVVNYISSPEVGFLKSVVTRINGSTKLIFKFLEPEAFEPSTNQTYGSLVKNLTFVKTFASGILIPKYYIWPVDPNLYLQPHTSVVSDAHREGLLVFASEFLNDYSFAYNYSYDPVAEVLTFIDNSNFSVDGLMSDFPVTPSQAIACYAHTNSSATVREKKPVVISHNGASGVYPGATDLAYQKAVDDGANIIDCSVQMTSDGIPVCLVSIDLLASTTVSSSPLYNRLTKVSEIQSINGVFTFNATWAEIQNLTAAIANPFLDANLRTNPAYANAGRFMTLSDFLKFAKSQSVEGVLLSVEWAAYLAEKQGLDVVGAVLSALSNSSFSDAKSPAVTIQSSDSSVLAKIKQQSKYKLMYKIDEMIRDAENSTLQDIKKFADAVAIDKNSVFPSNQAFVIGATDVIRKLHDFRLEAYVYVLRNEFYAQAWDFFSDPLVEINNYVQAGEVDGVITDFPGTATEYKRNACLNMGKNTPPFMEPVQPGGLIQLVTNQAVIPAAAPLPVLADSDVVEAPLPPVSKRAPATGGTTAAPTSPPSPSGQPGLAASVLVSMVMLFWSLLLL